MSTALTNLPKHHLARLARAGVALKRRIDAAKEPGERIAGIVLAAGEGCASAFALGAATARYGTNGVLNVPGVNVPVDLAVGAAALAGSFFIGKHADHLVNVGNGALAVYAARMGAMSMSSGAAAKMFGAKTVGVTAFPVAAPKAA